MTKFLALILAASNSVAAGAPLPVKQLERIPLVAEPVNYPPADSIEEEVVEEETVVETSVYGADDFRSAGVIYSNGYRWTWYSQRVLPGGGLNIPGRHVGEDGYIKDENGRLCLASSTLPKGTIVETPFGVEGCVYDSGCEEGTLDVYTDF
jgi:hypothetical protein